MKPEEFRTMLIGAISEALRNPSFVRREAKTFTITKDRFPIRKEGIMLYMDSEAKQNAWNVFHVKLLKDKSDENSLTFIDLLPKDVGKFVYCYQYENGNVETLSMTKDDYINEFGDALLH